MIKQTNKRGRERQSQTERDGADTEQQSRPACAESDTGSPNPGGAGGPAGIQGKAG